MLRRLLTGIATSVVAAATVLYAQTPAPPQGASAAMPAGGGAGPQGAGGRGGGAPEAADRGAVGRDAAQGQGIRRQGEERSPAPIRTCSSTSASSARRPAARATRTARRSACRTASRSCTPFPAPSPAQVLGGLRLFDNFYWIGNTGIGAWIITSDDGYILFDAMNSEADARDIIIPAMKKLNLDPMKIKYLVFGHYHFDHTGGGEYIQRMTGAKAIMLRDDWDIYLRSRGARRPAAVAVAAARRRRCGGCRRRLRRHRAGSRAAARRADAEDDA